MKFARELCCRKDEIVIQPCLALFLESDDGENGDNIAEDVVGGPFDVPFQILLCPWCCEMGGKSACTPRIDDCII